MKKSLLVIVAALIALVSEAQVQIPSPSPAGSVSTTVGLTDIKIDYSRPRVKGRRIFGEELTSTTAQPTQPVATKKKKGAVAEPEAPKQAPLVPFGKIWRTGANQGTKITFSDDVTVEGTKVPKGEYLIFTWPGATEWTVALYKDVKLGGNTNKYDNSQEAANFKVKPEKLTEKVETFTINVGDIADDSKSAKVQLAWENTSVKFNVGVDYDTKVMKSIDTYTKVNPGNYFQAAVYYLESGKDLNQALEWINKAADANPSAFWILHQKAKIQKGLGDNAGALATATASLEAAKKENNRDYQMMNEELIKSLK